jgi:diaminopimelate epimerase
VERARSIPFAKLQGAGNGYVVVDARGRDADWSALARHICDPHLGVGSDGLALVADSDVAPVRMRILNSDGSESEMSGNGIRLFAKFVLDRGLASADADGLRVETGGGVRTLWPVMGPSGMESARVAMGAPSFAPAEIPMAGPAVAGLDRVIDFPLEVAGTTLAITCLSIGNPHAVAILDTPIEDFPLARVGPAVMAHPLFPNRINFEIVNPVDRQSLRARIFERGEGETLASGTGSTASMIAAHLHGLVGDEARVQLRGGELRVRWAGAGEAELEGPAVEVFHGEWPLDGVEG